MPDLMTCEPPELESRVNESPQDALKKRRQAHAAMIRAKLAAKRRWLKDHPCGDSQEQASQTPCSTVSDDELVGVAVEIMRGDAPGQTRLAAVDVIRDMSGRKLVGQSQAYKPDPARLAALDRAARQQMGADLGERGAVVAVITSAGSRVIRGDARQVVRELAGVLGVNDVLAKEAQNANDSSDVSNDAQT